MSKFFIFYPGNWCDDSTSQALAAAFNPDPINGLYTSNASAPIGVQAGLRQIYEFGLYSHCAYINKTAGRCSNTTVANKFLPYDAVTSDMAMNYSQATDIILKGTTFHNSGYLGTQSKAAYYLILLGSICTALALFVSVVIPSVRICSKADQVLCQWCNQTHGSLLYLLVSGCPR